MQKEEEYSLTCGQRWLVSRWETNSGPAGPMQRIYLLTKDFNYSAFFQAMNLTVSCHPSLRLKLIKQAHEWRQSFPNKRPSISYVKVKGLFKKHCSIYANAIIAEEAKRVFDLRRDTPVKAKVLRVNKIHLLSLCIDHIAVDGISFDLFEKHLLLSYQQAIKNVPMSSNPSEAFFKFLAREVARQKTENENLEYWKTELKDLPKFSFLGIKRSNIGYVFNYEIENQEFDTLNRFCLERKCTLFTVIAVLQLLLLSEARNINDIILNIPFSNRILAEERGIVGNIFMPLRVRFRVIQNEPTSALLVRVKQKIWDAMLHRQYDYPSLQNFLYSESEKKGYDVGFTCSCNLIVDDALIYPNTLFVERLDQRPGRIYQSVPEGTFSLRARQTQSALSFEIIWDAIAWSIPTELMPSRFINTFKTIYASI